MNGKTIRLAVVAPDMENSGGVKSVVRFLVDGISVFPEFEVDLISLATSYKDGNSSRLLRPGTWLKGPHTSVGTLYGKKLIRVGASFVEFEFNRYRPRKILDQLVEDYDLVQIVSGLPAWGCVARNWRQPTLLQVATLAKLERSSSLKGGVVAKLWRRMMTYVTSRLDKIGVRYMDAVFVENRLMVDWLSNNFPQKCTVLAPPGIDLRGFDGPASKKVIEQKYILTVCRLNDPRKDIAMLVKAFHIFVNTVKDAPILVIAGKNQPLKEYEQVITSLSLQDRVMIMKDVSQDVLLNLYKNAELFVLSSKEEGLGIVLIEAMASGLPILTTDCGGPRTLIEDGHNGFFVKVGDYHELARQLTFLHQNQEIRQYQGSNNLVKAQQFSTESCFRPFVLTYRKLAKELEN